MNLVVRIVRCFGGYYRAWCPALPGCIAHGRTREEASEAIRLAVNAYLANLETILPKQLEAELVTHPIGWAA